MANDRCLRTPLFTRREALGLLGIGTAAALSGPVSLDAAEPQFPKGAIIRTVLADLPPSALAGGRTLFHEHLTHGSDWTPRLRTQGGRVPGPANPPPPRRDPTTGCANDVWEGCANMEFLVEELNRSRKDDGVICIVDGAHPDGGRNVGFLTEMSRRSGMHIVASGGYYLDWAYPPEIATLDEDQIAAILVKDATDNAIGAFGEIGTSDEITLNEHKVFRAVGKAHLATNIPIFTHTANGKCAQEQLDIFESVGVKPQRVVIGHLGSFPGTDIELHKTICKRGAFIGFDRQGGNNDERNAGMVRRLIDAGYQDNLLFSADFGNDAWPNWKQNGGPGISRAAALWPPRLRQAGVTDETIREIFVNNTRRFLAFVPKKPRPSKSAK